VILEVDLNYFIAQSEHNCMLRSHPFLNIDKRPTLSFTRFIIHVDVTGIFRFARNGPRTLIVVLEVRPKMLK